MKEDQIIEVSNNNDKQNSQNTTITLINPKIINVKNINNPENGIKKNEEKIKKNFSKKIMLNEKDLVELKPEEINNLKLSNCSICNSNKYYLFIPDVFTPENIEIMQKLEESQTSKYLETESVKIDQKQNICCPILLCQKNLQFCSFCSQTPHINTLCDNKFLKNSIIDNTFNSVNKNLPEEKKTVFHLMHHYILDKAYKINYIKCCDYNGFCTCKFTLLIIFLIFGFIIWTLVSVLLLGIGIFIFLLSYILRFFICLIVVLYDMCTKNRSDMEFDSSEDSCLAACGAFSLVSMIMNIPTGYLKIIELFKKWNE